MLRKLREILAGRESGDDALLSGLGSAMVRPQFDGRLLDQRREDVYVLMHQQMSSMR